MGSREAEATQVGGTVDVGEIERGSDRAPLGLRDELSVDVLELAQP
jgi:hypothetical protein